ncbi:MAG TPA: hypothetical protein VHE81_17035, partial [Lacipirellulaceae bacterium]|nr:hypothetical protein [Lacipirellulaceae bacterium]
MRPKRVYANIVARPQTMQNRTFVCVCAITVGFSLVARRPGLAKEHVLRAGIIGCDTSHVVAFTKLINNPKATGPLAGVKITAAYPGGSPDIPASRNRLAGFVKKLRASGIKIVDSLGELADQCDVFMVESVDGRPHLKQFRAVAKGRPVFIDKP